MKVEAYKATVDWRELWEVEYKDGCVFRTTPTGYHIKTGIPPVPGFLVVAITAKPGTYVRINPAPQEVFNRATLPTK
jgi:hypothetical protein|tara:strand:- start:17 stop:247 length:231 start_codon:yes stop_codon:yes gene_type:complete